MPDADRGDVHAAAARATHRCAEARALASPTSASAGRGRRSKKTSAVQAPDWPIFLSCGADGDARACPTRRRTPRCPRLPSALGSVRAKTMNRSASGALVMNRLAPLIT